MAEYGSYFSLRWIAPTFEQICLEKMGRPLLSFMGMTILSKELWNSLVISQPKRNKAPKREY
jgi:hypothetical protein